MKICISVRALPVHIRGGMEKHTMTLANGLARKGHEIHIITSAHPDGLSHEHLDGIDVYYLPGTTPGRYSRSFFRNMNRRLDTLDTQHKFDILHFQGFAGLTYSLRKRRPYIVTIHGTLFSETLLYHQTFKQLGLIKKIELIYRHRTRFLIYPFYRKLLANAERIVVDSDFTQRELAMSHPRIASKIRVVKLGIESEAVPVPSKADARKRLGLSENDFVLFTIGRIDETKGIDVALESLAILKERGDNVRYLIGGTGKLKETLSKLCIEKGLENVTFLGYIDEKDLPDHYAAADVFLFPEITAPAFGLVAIEAMKYATPVLASRRGAIPEIVQEHVGWTFNPGDPYDLADKISQLAHNPAQTALKSQHTIQHIKTHFSAEAMIENTISVYEEGGSIKN